jgi:predicted amidohydrolase
MYEPLVIAVAQPLCVPYDVAANAVTHAAAVRGAGARVVIFPELSLTGYELEMSAAVTSPPAIRSGSRWPASPARPAAATTRPRAVPASGRRGAS